MFVHDNDAIAQQIALRYIATLATVHSVTILIAVF